MTDIEKRLAEIEGDLEKLEKRATDAEAAVAVEKARADKAEGERDAAIEKAKKVEATGTAEDDLFKGLNPALKERFEQIEKRAAISEAALEKAREDAERAVDVAKVKAVGLTEVEGDILYRVRKGKTLPEDADKIEAILKQAAAGSKTLFKSLGSGAAVEDDEEAILKAKAEEIQKAEGGTYEVAYSKALDQNSALYGRMMEKRRAARTA